jgi:hypothetical protein
VQPLRNRLASALAAAGSEREATDAARTLYREAKTGRVDQVVGHVLRVAFGAGGIGAAQPGTAVCWVVDPDAAPCADAEDNALAGAVAAGEAFPTGHVMAPAYPGCRCSVTRHPA